MNMPIGGTVAAGFESVREAFVENFVSDGEVGASLHVIRDDEVLVDLFGGWTDAARSEPWRHDTLVNMYSVGKAFLSMLALQLVDDSITTLDTPVADYWPEFATGAKESATLNHVLTHRAGVPAIREILTDDDLFDWEIMTSAIADTEAWWKPGERVAYHTNTFGHIVGEIIRRLTGQTPGERLATLTNPLEADVHFGVPILQQHRCAEVIWAPPNPIVAPDSFDGFDGDLLMNLLAHLNPPGYSSIGLVNTERWRESQIGSTSGHASATGIARIYAGLLEGRILSEEMIAKATVPVVSAHCPILDDEFVYGIGFQPTTPRRPFGPYPRSFGHFGTGGAVGFADPDTGVAFGYAMNHVIPRWQSSRNRRLIDTFYACLDV